MKQQNYPNEAEQFELILPAGQVRLLLPPGVTSDINDLAKEAGRGSNKTDEIS